MAIKKLTDKSRENICIIFNVRSKKKRQNPITHESSHLTNIKDGKLIDKSLLK